MLGLCVSGHPLLGVEHIIARDTDISVPELMAAGEEEDDADEDERAPPAAASAQRGNQKTAVVRLGDKLRVIPGPACITS